MGVSSSESHDLTAFYEMLTASFGVLSQNTGFYPSSDRIVETLLGPLNLGPGGRSCNEPISHLQWHIEFVPEKWGATQNTPILPSRVYSLSPCVISCKSLFPVFSGYG